MRRRELVRMLWASDRIDVNEGGTMSEQHALVERMLTKAGLSVCAAVAGAPLWGVAT